MLSFQDFINEKLITFGGKAYPKFGNVVILAGGAGSGKGFQLDKLLGITGKVFDVDALKKLALKSNKFAQRVKDETGYDLSKFNLRNPENVSKVHELLSDVYGITSKNEQAVFSSILIAPTELKPNLIFDVTLKGMNKLETIARNVRELGYDSENIHIVWVVNDVNVAIEQNKSRDRVVPEEILMDTHEGAALTMKKILNMGDNIKKYMDGGIWLTFNKFVLGRKDNDTGIASSSDKEGNAKSVEYKGKEYKTAGSTGSFVVDANYIQVKKKGKQQLSTDKIGDDIYRKIKSYVPKTDSW